MIVLDTHIWVWWVQGDQRLTASQQQLLDDNQSGELGVSAISCWEVAKLAEIGRLVLPCEVLEWLGQALAYPGVRLLELTPVIAVASTQLPGMFHRDPADQIIVATSRVYDAPLLTVDRRILDYPHVKTLV